MRFEILTREEKTQSNAMRLSCFLVLFACTCDPVTHYTYTRTYTLSLLQEQNKDTGRKLGIATVLMCTLPILSYYLGLYLFADKSQPDSWAGGMAILMTNLIVAGYVISAFQEKEDDVRDQPRVGAFKTRTD